MSRISLTLIIAVLLSLVANIGLAQNYTSSLIPGVHDGIGITNFIAEIIIVSESWTPELFRSYFENSLIVTLLLLLLLVISLVFKKRDRAWGYYGSSIR